MTRPRADAPETRVPESAYVGRSPGFDRGTHAKIKWEVTLSRDPRTLLPTVFRIGGTLFRDGEVQGRWTITRGAAADPSAEVYELKFPDGRPNLPLLKVGENILLFLDRERNPLVGTGNFSFTLNRADLSSAGRRSR
jgi:hypothetical protein